MRFFWIFSIFSILLFASPTEDKIKAQTSTLQVSKELEIKLNQKLDDLAKDIIKGENDIKDSDERMKQVISQIAELEKNAIQANSELKKLTEQNSDLLLKQKQLEDSLIKIIADDFAFDLIIPKEYENSSESIMAREVLSKLNSVLKMDFAELAKDYDETLNLIKNQGNKIENIKSNLIGYKEKQAELANLQKAQAKALDNLKKSKESYSKKLSVIQKEQNEIRRTLEELKIVAREEAKEAQKREAQAKNRAQKPSDEDVKQIGSSYQVSKVKKYSGERTVAPLDSFKVKQKFGNYIDPIYNIKIFNESVILSSNIPNAKVKSVLGGKVVFAKDTAMLEKVVIIENSNGIHTIYAHLSQIAPTIKVGSKIPKGYVIGRVERDLTFEVTQKNFHIDPLEMISAR